MSGGVTCRDVYGGGYLQKASPGELREELRLAESVFQAEGTAHAKTLMARKPAGGMCHRRWHTLCPSPPEQAQVLTQVGFSHTPRAGEKGDQIKDSQPDICRSLELTFGERGES